MIRSNVAHAMAVVFVGLTSAACGGEETTQAGASNEVAPTGAVQALRAGDFMHQEGPPTSGRISIVRDSAGVELIELSDSFASDFATGTVVLYFAKSNANLDDQRSAGAGNVSGIVGLVRKNGKQYITIPDGIRHESYTHAVLWCETVGINFAAAALPAGGTGS